MSKVVLALVALLLGLQEEKKAPADPKPRVAMALPLAVVPGAPSKVTLRGLNLDQATEVKFAEPIEGATVAIRSKGKADLPKETDPAQYGDTKVELDLKLPAEFSPDQVGLIAVNAAGQAAPYELKVVAKDKLLLEKEPNGSFATAQPVEAGQVVQGSVSQAMDVDVYKVTGKKGEVWVFEVEAQRRGSILDPLLTVHDAGSRIVATVDDGDGTRDPLLRVTLPSDGVYMVSLIDAHNAGGGMHPYLLHFRRGN
jgi:hypothetical protein